MLKFNTFDIIAPNIFQNSQSPHAMLLHATSHL